ADSVQAIAGKLYILGGGWDTLFVGKFPARHPSLGIGIRFRVPWSFQADRFKVAIDLVDEDGKSIFGDRKIAQVIPVRRPEHLPSGSDISVVRAFTFNSLPLARAGGFAFRVLVEDEEVSRLRFWVRERRARPVPDESS
ncbi:MAG: hypothetical protein OEM97_11310, partial [Acidimicrobiia bacterium]|nr:hypothetical protein [Acidimicrobiia bacterium]